MVKSKRAAAPKEDIAEFMQKLEHPLAAVVESVRKLILKTDKQIGEQVKWNSPSFYYTGEMEYFDPKEYKRDIAVVNLHKKEYILLVFPTGAKINDVTGILEGDYADGRRVVKITDASDLKNKEKALKAVIKDWLSQIA